MAKDVKLSDIAVRVGVSTVSVSKALSGQKGVSDELRERIKVLADEMGYKQPSALKKQQGHTSYNIGVLISERYLDKYDSFYWQMYQEVTTEAAAKNCFTLLEVIQTERENALELPKLLAEKKVDAMIVIGGMPQAYLAELKRQGKVPAVYLDHYDESQECDAVISNGFYGAYRLTNYLYQMGHRKIAYVCGTITEKGVMDRYFGYRKSLLEHNIEYRDDYLVSGTSMDREETVLDEKVELPKDMPTAFVCNSDLTASRLIKKLGGCGYQVPDQISVVGFDNYLYPGLCDIGVTTYEVDIEEMARKVVSKVIDKIEKKDYVPSVSIVEGGMVCRESVRCLETYN